MCKLQGFLGQERENILPLRKLQKAPATCEAIPECDARALQTLNKPSTLQTHTDGFSNPSSGSVYTGCLMHLYDMGFELPLTPKRQNLKCPEPSLSGLLEC